MSSGSAPGELTAVFAHLHGMLLPEEDAITAVQQLARAAHQFVPSATGTGVFLFDDAGARITTAATDSAVTVADDLHHSLVPPRLQRDLLAHAVHEMLADIAPPRAPLASDVLRDEDSPAEGHDWEEHASAERHDWEEHASSDGDSDVMDRDDPGAPDE